MGTQSTFLENTFSCPYCSEFGQQGWYSGHAYSAHLPAEKMKLALINSIRPVDEDGNVNDEKPVKTNELTVGAKVDINMNIKEVTGIYYSLCNTCKKVAVWKNTEMIYPHST